MRDGKNEGDDDPADCDDPSAENVEVIRCPGECHVSILGNIIFRQK